MSEVKEIYDFYKKLVMKEGFDDWDEQIYNLASKSEEHFKVLLQLFEEETDLFYKLGLAHILTDLNCRKTIPFLLKTARETQKDNDYRFEALADLIKFEDPQAYDLMMELADPSYKIYSDWIIEELSDLKDEGNQLAKELLTDLKKKYKHFTQYRKPDEKF